MSYSHTLNFLKGGIQGIIQGTPEGVMKRDTRRLDYNHYNTIPSSISFSFFSFDSPFDSPLLRGILGV